MIKYNKHSIDLQPFVDDAVGRHRLKGNLIEVRGYLIKKGHKKFSVGSIVRTTYKGNDTYCISVCRGRVTKNRYEPLENTLTTLAHELAHLDHWDHGQDHWSTMSSIMMNWTDLISKYDYTKGGKHD